MLQELADELWRWTLKMNSEDELRSWTPKMNKSKTGDDGKRYTNICQQHSDGKRWKLHIPGTEIQHQRQKPRQEESYPDWQQSPNTATSSRVTLEHHEETSLQLMCTKERTGCRTNKDGKKYVKPHISGQKKKHLGKRKDKGHWRDGTSQKTEVDLDRARQQNMETLRKEKT